MAGSMGMCGRGCARQEAWVCVAGGTCVAGEMATAADGMHPIGMHSCSNNLYTEWNTTSM